MENAEIVFQDNETTVVVSPIIPEEKLNEFLLRLQIPEIKAKSIKRKCEWVTTHYLLRFVFGENVTYCYNAHGKPELIDRNEKISISHSRECCALIVNKEKSVGIDIEEPTERIYRIAERFITKEEKIWVNESENKLETLYLIWCAKESLYKITELKPDFIENLFVDRIEVKKEGEFNAKMCIENKVFQYTLHYINTGRNMLVFTKL